jgi:dihydroorotase
MRVLIKGATIVNPLGEKKGINDILTENGIVSKIAPKIEDAADTVIDAAGLCAFPGFVDMHCHLREPGFEYKEDILSGTRAAVNGGFTAVACMPNTFPAADNAAVIRFILDKAKEAGYAKVYPVGAISKDLAGSELAEMGAMKEAGAVAVSDDGKPVMDGGLMRNALLYAKDFGLTVISHCEDLTIKGEGLANEGYHATITGLKGIPRAAEESMIARDILLAESYGARLHIAHVSTKGGVELIRQAKRRGANVTAETCPHYFAADDSFLLSFDANTKVNPPLRTAEDCEAIIEGLKDGTIDAIATDHAPHHRDEKNVEFALAASGISGLDTAFSLVMTHLYPKGFTLDDICRLMSCTPAKLLGIPGGVIREGEDADIVLADVEKTYILKEEDMASRGKNTPFLGKELKGRVQYTLIRGKILLNGRKIQ